VKQEEIEAICKERLGNWQGRLVNEHSTPVLLLGVGHDHKMGQVVLCTTEDMSDLEIINFVQGTLNLLIKQRERKN